MLLWLTTTPAPTDPPTALFPVRLQSDVIAYNSAAAAAIKVRAEKIGSCDLFGAVVAACGEEMYETCPGVQIVGGIHYEPAGWELLAATVAGCVRSAEAAQTKLTMKTDELTSERPRHGQPSPPTCCSGPVANASCWGWSASNAALNTWAIQSALDCAPASTVVIDGRTWVVAPPPGSGELDFAPPHGSGRVFRQAALNFSAASNKWVVFESGSVLLAERGSFHMVKSSLAIVGSLRAPVRNLTIVGEPGARWRMWKEDYQTKAYSVSEWRHGLLLWWAVDTQVSGLTIANTGGDGVLVGGMEGGGGDRSNTVGLTQRVRINNLTCDGNHRQGLSLINCMTCVIEDCVFSRTNGTKPMAGVDIEPDNAGATLQDIVFRRCVSRDNLGNGFQLSAAKLDPAVDPPISITFEDCHAVWTKGFDWGGDYLRRETNLVGFMIGQPKVAGSVTVVDSSVTGSAGAGLCVVDKPASGATVSVSNLVLRGVARFDIPGSQDPGMHPAPIHLIDEIGGMGGIYLSNIVVLLREPASLDKRAAAPGPVLRYDATSCGKGPPSHRW
jgi:hypothetical protein